MRHIVAAVVCSAVAVTAFGCTRDTNTGPPGAESPTASEPAATGTAAVPRDSPTASNGLTVTSVSTFRGPAPGPIIRGPGGLMLVQFRTGGGARGWYRIYDSRWRPRTPLLQINADLQIAQATRQGFIGFATAWKGERPPHYRHWVRIQPDGSLREIAREPQKGDPPRRPRSSDALIPASWNPAAVYRPAEDRVFLRRMPDWYRSHRGLGIEPGRRTLCAHHRRDDPIRTSTDAGRTWRVIPGEAVPHPPGTVLYGCETSKNRVLIQTGDLDAVRATHVLDRMNGQLLRTHLYPSFEGGWALLLPSGVLVASADRHGVLVGTDASNRDLTYRRAPGGRTRNFWILGGRLVATSTRWKDSVLVSTDQARTWRPVNLHLPPTR